MSKEQSMSKQERQATQADQKAHQQAELDWLNNTGYKTKLKALWDSWSIGQRSAFVQQLHFEGSQDFDSAPATGPYAPAILLTGYEINAYDDQGDQAARDKGMGTYTDADLASVRDQYAKMLATLPPKPAKRQNVTAPKHQNR
jgi:hypothetical protein